MSFAHEELFLKKINGKLLSAFLFTHVKFNKRKKERKTEIKEKKSKEKKIGPVVT